MSRGPRAPIRVAAALRWGRALLRASAALDPALTVAERHREVALLLSAASDWTPAQLIAWPERPLTAAARARFADDLLRRRQGEPVAYLLGRRAFWDVELTVTPAVLIPRPETELLVEWALTVLPAAAPLRCADLGTGSGALALALARARPCWRVLALERSAAALEVARGNARRCGVGNVSFVQGDWLAAFGARCLDAALTNPPYLAAADPHLARGDPRFEPRLALVAGADGLAAIDRIVARLAQCLRPGGYCAIEHGGDQAAAVRARLAAAGFADIATRPDLAGHARMTAARLAVPA